MQAPLVTACNPSSRLSMDAALNTNPTPAACFQTPAHPRRRDAGHGTMREKRGPLTFFFIYLCPLPAKNVLSWVTAAQRVKPLAPSGGGCSAKVISPFGVCFLWPQSLSAREGLTATSHSFTLKQHKPAGVCVCVFLYSGNKGHSKKGWYFTTIPRWHSYSRGGGANPVTDNAAVLRLHEPPVAPEDATFWRIKM